MKLITEGLIGSAIFTIGIGLFALAAEWPIDAAIRIDAFLLILFWAYVFVGHWYIVHNYILGEAELRRIRSWVTPADSEPAVVSPQAALVSPMPQPQQVIDAPVIERLLPVNKEPAPVKTELPDGRRVSKDDLRYFVERLDDRGHTRGAWDSVVMPSGKKVDGAYHKLLIEAVAVSGEFPVRGQGIKAKRILTTKQIKEKLHL